MEACVCDRMPNITRTVLYINIKRYSGISFEREKDTSNLHGNL